MSLLKSREKLLLFIFACIVLISRLPFLDAGYGVEEDSWGIAVAAYHTQLYGVMEASRLPGHPVNEFIYSLFWGHGAWLYNLFSALCSVVCFVLLFIIAKKLNQKQPLLASLALVFTPVVYINSTCTIDYLWALMFALSAFYFLISKKLPWAAILLGLAVGCRINSAVLFIPFLVWMFYENNNQIDFKQWFVFCFVFGCTSLLCFAPIIQVYGLNFFSYSDQFPYPNFPKIIYKATIGVIGLPALITLFFVLINHFNKRTFKFILNQGNAFFFSLLIIQLFSYLMLPQKSAYLMLLVPFGIIWLSQFLTSNSFTLICVMLIFSSFFMSINISDSYRGAKYSNIAIKKTIAGQEIFFDFLSGPIQNDYSKRLNKLNYTAKVLHDVQKINYPTVVICGWWFNQILIQQMEMEKNSMVKFAFYLNPTMMENYALKGYQIYYLSEQDIYNDLFYRFNRTKSLSSPF